MKERGEPSRIRLWDLGLQVVTPSKISPWREPLVEGERFTCRQLAAMFDRGIDPETVETIEVLSRSTSREMWAPSGTPLPDVQITCPVIGRTPAGRVKVLAPTGWPETVGADGRVLPPRFGRAA